MFVIYLYCVPDGEAEAAGDEQDGSTHMVVTKSSSGLLRVVANDICGPKVQHLALVQADHQRSSNTDQGSDDLDVPHQDPHV